MLFNVQSKADMTQSARNQQQKLETETEKLKKV